MKNIRAGAVALAPVVFLAFLGGCDLAPPPQPGAPTPNAQTPQGVARPTRAGQPLLGRYVDPATMEVTGLSEQFSTSDRIFASLPLADASAGVPVVARLLDAQGRELAKRESPLEAGQSRVNFDFDIPAKLQLAPGTYTIEYTLSGKASGSNTFTVR